MDQSRIRDYLLSLSKDAEGRLGRLRKEAEASDVPIIKPDTEELLRTMVQLLKPESILEIGTAIGYSAMVMADCSEAGIVTIESYEKRIPMAKANFDEAGFTDRISLMEGDAGLILPRLCEEGRTFDLIFLDAAKGQYINWLPDIKRLMKKGALLFTDNVLLELTVMESRYTVERRDRTTHKRMREFLHAIKHDEELISSVLPVGDGVSLSVRL
ncbi:MAG TPA: O-methyltransferase [Candidatus Avilachnospira avistercoris]|nr:O-methyltransferase [Candidatus Avilachnospira avistercoris]